MEADRDVEILGGGPERLVTLVVDHLVAIRVGADEAGLEAQLLAGEAHLGDRQIDRLQGQHRDAEQAVGIGPAIIGEPAVVGAAGRGGEFRVVDRTGEQAEARVEKGGIDAVVIHVRDALVRVEAAGLAVLVGHRVGLDDALPRADGTDPADAGAAVADRMLLDDQPLLAVLALDDARRPVAEFRIDVFVPQIERFEDVGVRVYHVVSVLHCRLRPFPSKPNERLVVRLRGSPGAVK